MAHTPQVIERVYREESGRILAALIASLRDFTLAEDALQDAAVAALQQWPASGIPRNPAAWLTTIARRKAIDRLRRDSTLARKQELLQALEQLAAQDSLDAAEDA
ncbi:MAG: sigma factor, partial [Nitrososphaerota archaeon]